MSDSRPLPPFINTDGAWEDVCSRLYGSFETIFKCNPRRMILGKRLVFDERRLESDKEEGFWHVITKGKPRLFDSSRARRLDWIAAILDGQAQGVSRFAYIEGDGTKKLYFWMEAEDYVLILAERTSVISLVTAFYIDNNWAKNDLAKKRNKGISF